VDSFDKFMLSNITKYLEDNNKSPIVIVGSETAKILNKDLCVHISTTKEMDKLGYCIELFGCNVVVGDFKYGFKLEEEE